MSGAAPAGGVREGGTSTDEAEIAALVAAFFDAFTTGPDVGARLEALRGMFLPQAVVVRTCGSEPTVYDVDGFIDPRRELLTNGTLGEFREWEVRGRTDLHGHVAHRFSSYAKAGLQDGRPFTGSGTKTIQFVRTTAGWRVSALAWDDEPGN